MNITIGTRVEKCCRRTFENFFHCAIKSKYSMKALKKFFNTKDPFLIQFAVYTLIGLWYIDSDKKWKKVLYAVYKLWGLSLLISLLFLEIVDVLMLKQDMSKVAERLCAVIVTVIITVKTFLTLRYTNIFYDLQDKLKQFRERIAKYPEDLALIEKTSKRIVNAAKILYIGAIFGVISWTCNPTLHQNRKLPFPIKLPVNTEISPTYEILYIYLTIILFMFAGSVVASILGFGSYLMIINAHFGVLKQNIERIHQERKEVTRMKLFFSDFNLVKMKTASENEIQRIKDERTILILREAIEIQKFIYNEIDNFKQLHSKNLLVHIVGILFAVAVVEATGLTDDFTVHLLKRILIVGFGISEIFLICRLGEELQYKSSEIVEVLYMTPWHEMNIKVQKLILLMSINSRRPRILKAGNTIRLNLATFLNIMRVVYNFVLLLRHTATRNNFN